MSTIYIANTNFEFELAGMQFPSLEQSLSLHPLCLQLQFLPLLYAQPQDQVAVTTLPSPDYLASLLQLGWWSDGLPRLVPLHLHEQFQGKKCVSWGPSKLVQAWSQARHMHYAIPTDWEMIRLINSKAFSFRYSSLPGATLIANEQELTAWLHQLEGPKVLKTSFGLSGQGNWILEHVDVTPQLLAFCQKEWQQGRALIGEPWLQRVCDFSTQWIIHPEGQIEEVGATRFETNAQGAYQGTWAGPEESLFASYLPFLAQHRQVAKQVLKDMAARGFFGPVGIDALLYRCPHIHSIELYPLVEINGRQTMSLVALRLQQRLCPQQVVYLTFNHSAEGAALLPLSLIDGKGKEVRFRRQLRATIKRQTTLTTRTNDKKD